MSRRAVQSEEDEDQREAYYRDHICRQGALCPNYDAAAVNLVLNLIWAYDVCLGRVLSWLSPHGLSEATFNVMMVLRNHEQTGCPLTTLSRLLLVSRANITGLVDSLERKGLVERAECESDRRVVYARLTDAGRALLDELLPSHFANLKQMLGGLEPGEIEALTRLLVLLRRAVVASGAAS